MNHDNQWRLTMARQIAPVYAANPKVAVVAVSGSVGRGWADRYSDIELDVYWREPPTDEDRQEPIRRLNGDIINYWPLEDEEWSEDYLVQGVQLDLSHFLAATIEQYLSDVIEGMDTAVLKQLRLAGIRHAIPLYGEGLFQQWQTGAALYPDTLARKVVAAALNPDVIGVWYLKDVLLARQDWLMLYDILGRMQRYILSALLGLNRMYLAHPGHKWQKKVIAEMTIKPPNLGQRLDAIWQMEPATAVSSLHAILEETINLAEQHLPDLDMARARQAIRRQRRPWDGPPTE